MGKWTDYDMKPAPVNEDDLMIYDSASKENKRATFSAVLDWMLKELANATMPDLQTDSKTMLGAINELKEQIDSIGTGGDEIYTVSSSLENCSISNSAKTVKKGTSYNAVITAISGYALSSVSCTMGGVSQTVTDGKINISSVTGNIIITAIATENIVEKPKYTITTNLTKCTIDNSLTTIEEGSSYTATVTPDENCTLGSVTCTMGGTTVPVSGGVINISSVTGNIIIIATATENASGTYYNVNLYGMEQFHCTPSNTATKVLEGSSYTNTITANSGYKFGNVVCKMGGNAVYIHPDDRSRTINISSVTGDISITAVTVADDSGTTEDETYTITNNLTNCDNSNSATSVVKGKSYAATITAKSGYTLSSVTCTMGGIAQTVTNGVINISSVTGNIVITATATKNATADGEHSVTYNLLNCETSQTTESVKSGSTYSTTITPKADYDLYVVTYTLGTDDINQIKKGSDATNSVNINITSLTDDLTITALAVNSANKGSGVLTATQINDDITAGWNLGNTFDASSGTVLASAKNRTSSEGTDYETMWGQPVTTKAMIKAVYDKGFNAIRIPITWNHHIVDKDQTGNNISIASAFLSRVKEVVDYAYDLGMYVMINTHHDTADYSNGKANLAACNAGSDAVSWATDVPFQLFNAESVSVSNAQMCTYIKRLWTVIANAFKEYDHHLIFEGYNEILGKGRSDWSAPSAARQANAKNLNQAFVDAVRATGGNNATRVLSVETYGAMLNSASVASVSGLTDSANDALLLQAHYYTSVDNAVINESTNIRAIGRPVIMGEMAWDSNDSTVHDDNMHDFAQNYIANAKSVNIKCFWWDENTFNDYSGRSFGLLERASCTWKRPRIAQGIIDGVAGNTIVHTYNFNYEATAENVDADFKNGTYPSISGKTIDKISEVGNFSAYTGYGSLCTTLKISGNNNVFVEVGNDTCDEVGDATAYKIKRCICIDKDHQIILDYQDLKLSDAVQGLNNATIVPPVGTVYMRLSFVQIYSDYITSDSVKTAIKAGKAWIRIKSDNEVSIDHSDFTALADNIKLDNSKYVLANNLKAGYIVTQHDLDVDGLTGFSVGDIKPALDYSGLTNKVNQYGSVTSLFKGCKQGDTITIHPVTPGYGNSYHVYCTTRYAWYDSNNKVVEATRLPSATSDPVTLTCPAGASKLRVTCANPYDLGTIISNGGTEAYIINKEVLNGWIRIEYTVSSSAITKGTSTEV